MFKSLASSFLMYSRIPMPRVEWKEENRRYSLCFFPLIGAVIGFFIIMWYQLCEYLNIGNFLFSIVSVCIPVMITGGIHIDGFCDVNDALASYGDKKRKIEIMKDSHIGAFAVIRLVIYFLLQTGIYSECGDFSNILAVSFVYVLSRALSGITAITFRCAKKEGTLQDFVNPSHKKITFATLVTWIIAVIIGIFSVNPLFSAVTVVIALSMVLYYRFRMYKEFGGITGDTAGWFLQVCELTLLFGIILASKITEAVL